MTTLVVLEAVVIVLLTVLVAGLLRSHAEILRRLHQLGAGDIPTTPPPARRTPTSRSAPLPVIAGATPSGGEAAIALSDTRGNVLLAFLTTGCSSCRPLWNGLADLETPDPDTRIAVVTKGAGEESPATVSRSDPGRAAVLMSTEAWDAFQIPVAPYFVLVDASDGTVLGEGAAGSWPQVFALLDVAQADHNKQTTRQRLADTDEELRRAGIEPEDSSLYRRPSDGGRG